ncbi:hypothetical protein ABPG75_008558 [Micractinium tetrahymenae]
MRRNIYHLPKGRRPGQGGKPVLPVTLKWAVLILVVAAVGWVQLRRYEQQLHMLHEDGGNGNGRAGGRAADRQGIDPGGLPSSSAACAAKLAASGVLPDTHAASGAGAVAATAQSVKLLTSRRRLYDAMEASLLSKGLALGATITQGLRLGDMLRLDADGRLQPVLEALAVPVRAIVMPLQDQHASGLLFGAVKRHLAPLVPSNGIWLQDSGLYHSTIYHASTHTEPVPASGADVDSEELAIREVGTQSCPLHVVLERVVATPAGAVVACWQVVKGTDVYELRRRLAASLPRASRHQIVQDRSILHTTLARIVAPPHAEPGADAGGTAAQRQRQRALKQRERQRAGRRQEPAGKGGEEAASDEAAVLLQAAVDRMTQELCGLEAVMDRLWFAEEYHKLALALNGRVEKRDIPLKCDGGEHAAAGQR